MRRMGSPTDHDGPGPGSGVEPPFAGETDSSVTVAARPDRRPRTPTRGNVTSVFEAAEAIVTRPSGSAETLDPRMGVENATPVVTAGGAPLHPNR
jgi:hypothetical protein